MVTVPQVGQAVRERNEGKKEALGYVPPDVLRKPPAGVFEFRLCANGKTENQQDADNERIDNQFLLYDSH